MWTKDSYSFILDVLSTRGGTLFGHLTFLPSWVSGLCGRMGALLNDTFSSVSRAQLVNAELLRE